MTNDLYIKEFVCEACKENHEDFVEELHRENHFLYLTLEHLIDFVPISTEYVCSAFMAANMMMLADRKPTLKNRKYFVKVFKAFQKKFSSSEVQNAIQTIISALETEELTNDK